jgi:hypothetical protein
LKSGLNLYPASCAAAIKASCSSWLARMSLTASGPPVP